MLLATCVLTFAFALFRYDGPAKGYWDTYITAPAMFMNKQPVNFVLRDGSPAFEPQLKGVLPDDLVSIAPEGEEPGKQHFGIITKDQRLGGGIVASVPYAFFGQFGFRVVFAFGIMLLIPLTVLVFRETWSGYDWAGLFGGVLLAWNPYMLNVDRLNSNGLVFPLMLLLLYLMLRLKRTGGQGIVLMGLVFGVLAGIRNEAICFVPAICYWMLRPDPAGSHGGQRSFAARFGRLTLVGALCVLALSPILYWKWYAFGHPLMHPSQFPHFQGFRPTFEHSLLGWHFSFNGLFNWPLHDQLVRTPHFGYPTYLLFPLVTARALGTVGVALVFYGVYTLWRVRREVVILLLIWMLPVYVLFGPQENWEEVKMTFMLLAWPPLGVFAAAGLVGLRQLELKPALMHLAAVTAAVFCVVKLLGMVAVPEDDRWYVRFPNASLNTNAAAQAGLDERDRNDALYFQSYETEAEIAYERGKLSAGWPWPMRYLPLDWDFGREWSEMGTEIGERELVVEDIWGYIYGSRKL